ncbi:MAG: hypothetical protein ACM3SY_17995 [Candidatus Omnitrophota bacterium]
MKRNVCLRVCVGVCFVAVMVLMSTFTYGQWDEKLQNEMKKFMMGKEYAVLEYDSVPAESSKGFDKSLTIIIENGGKWRQDQAMGLQEVPSVELKKGQVFEVRKVRYNDKGIEVLLRTDNKVKYHKKGKEVYSQQGVWMYFYFDPNYLRTYSEENHNYIKNAIGNYLKFYEKRPAAKKGMS